MSRRSRRKSPAWAAGFAPLAAIGCITGCHRGDDAQGGPEVAVRLVDLGREVSSAALPAITSPAAEGRAPASKLTSLSYLISQVQICENLKPDSHGISGAQGCVDVYRLSNPPDESSFSAAAARADGRYVDILDANQRQVLTTPVPVPATSYAYGIVRWVGPAKVVAQVPLADGSASLFTHDGDLDVSDQSTHAPDLTAGPARQALAVQGSQEGWFRFYLPLDLRAGSTAHSQEEPNYVDLAFDADALVGGTHLAAPSPSILDAAGHSILVPPLDLNPLPALAGRPVRVETYILRQSKLTAAAFDLRLSIYVRDDDPSTILSLDLRSARVTGSPANPAVQKVAFLDPKDDGTLSLINHVYLPMVSGLMRGQKVGDVSHAVLPCNGVLPALVAAGCTSGEAAVDVELAAITLLAPPGPR